MNIQPSLLEPFVYFCSCPGPPPKQRVHRVFVPKRGTNFAFMQYFYKLLSPLLWHHQLERVQREVFNLMVHMSRLFFYACILFLTTSICLFSASHPNSGTRPHGKSFDHSHGLCRKLSPSISTAVPG